MTKITLISLGTLKEKYLLEAYSEYKKRLSQFAKVDEINLKEELIKNEDDKSEIERALRLEGEKILSNIPEGATVFAACVEGAEYNSLELSSKISNACDASGKLCFIIGSSHGLSETVKKRADYRLSVSRLTFPHQLMRVILSEALYRSFTIIHGKKYHK
jgi:23S rRNA (pseudouridine1915-N3)-methyltransferase